LGGSGVGVIVGVGSGDGVEEGAVASVSSPAGSGVDSAPVSATPAGVGWPGASPCRQATSAPADKINKSNTLTTMIFPLGGEDFKSANIHVSLL
jgi:hypothetical protein